MEHTRIRRQEGSAVTTGALHDLARRLARLRPDWRDPERFFMARAELATELARHARALETAGQETVRPPIGSAWPRGSSGRPSSIPSDAERLRRLTVLARAQAEEIAKLHRLLALAVPRSRPRRARLPDPRQGSMEPFWSCHSPT
jgi:hypothetical protein